MESLKGLFRCSFICLSVLDTILSLTDCLSHYTNIEFKLTTIKISSAVANTISCNTYDQNYYKLQHNIRHSQIVFLLIYRIIFVSIIWLFFNNLLFFVVFHMKIISGGQIGLTQMLHQVNLQVISNQACARVFGNDAIIASTLCTATSNGQSTCGGDSGGALAIGTGVNRQLVSYLACIYTLRQWA